MVLGRARWCLMTMAVAASAHGEGSPSRRMTLRHAAEQALARHPVVATARRKEAAAEARVDVARSEGLPRVSAVGQVSRSTGNAVPGATFSMVGIPGVQGPPGAARFGGGAWQSTVGVTASWDILELVRRPAIVDAIDGDVASARAQSEVTRLFTVVQTADAYLVALEAQALVKAAEASQARTKTFHDVVATLVEQTLRPEIDLARADTDLAAVRVIVEKTRLGAAVTVAKLAESVGESTASIDLVDTDFATLPAAMVAEQGRAHPAVVAHDVAAQAAERRASAAKLGYLPKVDVVGAAWMRGGGYVLGGGPNDGTADGLLPDTPNWAVGVVATWTPTEMINGNAKARAENADAAVQRAKATEVSESLVADLAIARATFVTALAVAREATAGLIAARRSLVLANARYTSALGNVLDVADAERALAAAERDDAVARLEAWRAVVALCRARGDMTPLLGGAAKGRG